MKYPHIILNDLAVKDVRYESRGIGPKYSALDKNRQGQADMVQRWYWDAISQSKERRSNLFAKDVCADGSYIAMEIDAKHCNMDALDTSKGARLMSVNTLGNESDIQEALLFLPDRNEKWLQGKIEKYSDNSKDGKNGQPANALLINSIQSMKVAVASDFFSSKEDLQVFYTTSSKTCLSVEIWLSKDADGCSIDDTLNKLKLLHAHCSNRFIEFSNSYVVLATMPRGEIEKICYSINGLSELRIFKDARVLLEADNIGENEWVGLIKENTKSLPGLVRVGILDSGVSSEHELLSEYLPIVRCHNVTKTLSNRDKLRHGTLMAGLVQYGDLTNMIYSPHQLDVYTDLCSAKIVPGSDEQPNERELFGVITEDAIVKSNNDGAHIMCMAVTSSSANGGEPSSWSSAIDEKLFNGGLPDSVLFVSAGNVRETDGLSYPNYNINAEVEDPGQAWNAITVGAYTEKTFISDENYQGVSPEAPKGGLSPYSTTSCLWDKSIIKPEILMEGGNAIRDGQKLSGAPSELNLVSTNSNPLIHQFGAINATSAATALAARLAAKIKHSNPTLSPLTIRGLMVHSAEWTDEMVRQCSNNGIRNIDLLLHSCGYGVPNEQKAVMSDESHVTFIAEQEIHPFDGNSKKCRFDNMHILELPWPKDLLENMGEVEVKMKVTLSFYIQPAPGAKTRLNKYAYPSSLLRFDVKTAEESYEQFEKRISHVFQDGVDKSLNDTGRWQIGIQRRNRGSVISDSFVDSAVKIASCGYIAVYPASGWLKNMNYREEYNTIKYSLIVTLETPNVNIYHAIPVMQEVMV